MMKKGWNYPVKGEMPERQENGVSDHVIVAVEGGTYAMAGYYDFDMKKWFVDGCSNSVNVYAWKKVKLPKEKV